jgi:hypothetical protein
LIKRKREVKNKINDILMTKKKTATKSILSWKLIGHHLKETISSRGNGKFVFDVLALKTAY